MNLFDFGLTFDYIDTRITWDIRYNEYGQTWLSIFCGDRIITSLAVQNPQIWEDEILPYHCRRWNKCN